MVDFSNVRGCSIADCDYMARPASGKCFAHEQGKHPAMSFAQYQAQGNLPADQRRDSLGSLVSERDA